MALLWETGQVLWQAAWRISYFYFLLRLEFSGKEVYGTLKFLVCFLFLGIRFFNFRYFWSMKSNIMIKSNITLLQNICSTELYF